MKKSVLPIALGGAALLGILFLSGNASAKGRKLPKGGTFTPPEDGGEVNPALNDPVNGPAIVPRGRSPLGPNEDTIEPSFEHDEGIRAMAESLLEALLECWLNNEIPALLADGPRSATEKALALTQTYQCSLAWAQSSFDLDAYKEAGMLGDLTQLIETIADIFVDWIMFGSTVYEGVFGGEAIYQDSVVGKSIRNVFYNFIPADVTEAVTSQFGG